MKSTYHPRKEAVEHLIDFSTAQQKQQIRKDIAILEKGLASTHVLVLYFTVN